MVIAKQVIVFICAYGALIFGFLCGAYPHGTRGDLFCALATTAAGGSCLMYYLFPL